MTVRRKFLGQVASFSLLSFLPGVVKSNHLLQAAKKNTNIYLRVNTGAINNGNINSVVQVTDDRGGSSSSGSPVDFLSPVDLDKWVTWTGSPTSNSGDKVMIRTIRKKGGGPSLLGKDEYRDNNNKGEVKAKVKKQYQNGTMTYLVQFEVIYANGSRSSFTLDPKIKMNP